MVHPRISRLLDATRFLGLRHMLWIAPRWLVRPEYDVLTRDLHPPLPQLPPGEPLHWTDLRAADIPHVLGLNPAMSEAEIRRRWEEGQECVLGWREGTLVYHQWYGRRPVYLRYLGRTLRLLKADYVMLDTFTHPALRGHGIAFVSTLRGFRRARDLGFARLVTIIAYWNTPGLRLAQNAGFTSVGTVGYWNIGLRRYFFATGKVCLEGDMSLSVLL